MPIDLYLYRFCQKFVGILRNFVLTRILIGRLLERPWNQLRALQITYMRTMRTFCFFHEYSLLNIQKIDKEKNNTRLDSFPIIMRL